MKTCRTCKIDKSLDNFYKFKKSKDGLEYRCKECCNVRSRAYQLKNPDKTRSRNRKWLRLNRVKSKGYKLKASYDLTMENYNKMLIEQNGVCAVCKNPENTKHRSGCTNRLSVDHNHTTGKIRQLLCTRCNSLIGMSKENISTLLAAVDYLRKFEV